MAVPVLPPRVVAATDQAQFRWFVLANGLRVLLVHGHLSSDDAVATARALPTAVDARPAEASELMRRRGLNFTIQSSTHSTVDIAQRADSFISGLPAALAALPALGKDEAVALLSDLLDLAKARRRSVMLDPASKPPKSSAAASFSDREAWKRTRQFR